MARIDILATFGDDDDKGCGYRECETALEAVLLELKGSPDTSDAISVSAADENMVVTAYRLDSGHEVHIYIGDEDVCFTVE